MRNPWLCVIIVCFLGAGGIIGLVGLIVLYWAGRPAPEAIIAISAGAFANLASFLVRPLTGAQPEEKR